MTTAKMGIALGALVLMTGCAKRTSLLGPRVCDVYDTWDETQWIDSAGDECGDIIGQGPFLTTVGVHQRYFADKAVAVRYVNRTCVDKEGN